MTFVQRRSGILVPDHRIYVPPPVSPFIRPVIPPLPDVGRMPPIFPYRCAVAHVKSQPDSQFGPGTTMSIVITDGVTAGSALTVFWEIGNNARTVSSIAGGGGSGWSILEQASDATAGKTGGCACLVNADGGAVTVVLTFDASVATRVNFVFHEASGVETADVATAVRDSAILINQNPGGGTDAFTSGALTTQSGDYVFGAVSGLNFGGNFSAGTSFTRTVYDTTNDFAGEYLIDAAPSAATFTDADAGFVRGYVVGVALKPAATAGQPAIRRHGMSKHGPWQTHGSPVKRFREMNHEYARVA